MANNLPSMSDPRLLDNQPVYGAHAAGGGVSGLTAMQNITEAALLDTYRKNIKKDYKPFTKILEKRFTQLDVVADGQTRIQNRVDLLGALLDYGATYMDQLSGFNVEGLMPFNKQIGPMKGCTLLPGGKLRLDSPGQWNIFSQITVDWLPILDPNVWLISRVRDDTGAEYSVKEVRDSSNWVMTLSCTHPVVVPAPGYTVEVEAKFSVVRKVLGGPARNHLVAQHISLAGEAMEKQSEQSSAASSMQEIMSRTPDTWSESEWAQVAKASGKTVEVLKDEAKAQGYSIP